MIDICMYGCRSCNFTCKYCFGPDKSCNDKFILNEEKVLEAIAKSKAKTDRFMIWGGEPLLHRDHFEQTLHFLKTHFPEAQYHFSTNGLLLKDKSTRDFIAAEDLYIQLSIDGVAQGVRSTFNPLDDEDISMFLKDRIEKVCMNCVIHNQNYSVMQNVAYFRDWMMKYDCLESSLTIRFTPFYESDLTPDYNLSGENLRTFIHEYELLFIQVALGDPDNPVFKHFRRDVLHRVNPKLLSKCKIERSNPCTKFFMGKTDVSRHIDTSGAFVSCNLIDSGIDPRGKVKKNIPDYCKGCEFEGCRGCYPCPSTDYVEKCEWKKEWMRFIQRMKYICKYTK